MLASTLNKAGEDRRKQVVGFLRQLLVDFHPAAMALGILCDKRVSCLHDAEKGALSAAIYRLLRSMLPSKVPVAQTFEYTYVLLSWMLRASKPTHAASEVYKDTALTDPITHTRFVHPVLCRDITFELESRKETSRRSSKQ